MKEEERKPRVQSIQLGPGLRYEQEISRIAIVLYRSS
jgi:hypothetical protein